MPFGAQPVKLLPRRSLLEILTIQVIKLHQKRCKQLKITKENLEEKTSKKNPANISTYNLLRFTHCDKVCGIVPLNLPSLKSLSLKYI